MESDATRICQDVECPPDYAKKNNNGSSQACWSSTQHDNGLDGGDETGHRELQSSEGHGHLDIDKSSSTADSNTVPSSVESCESIDPSHEITFTVSIVLGVHKGGEEDPGNAKEKTTKKEKGVSSTGVVEAPKSQGYYHIEYNLLPCDPEPTKVDLVLFGLAAKIYMENETKVLKPWQEGERMWLGWSQAVKIKVTRDLLVRMASHKVTFRVWDTKEQVSAKARSDRPKAFRLPQGRRPGNPDHHDRRPPDCEAAKSGGIKAMLHKLRTLLQNQSPTVTASSMTQRNSTATDLSELKCVTVKPQQATCEAVISKKAFSLTVLNADCSVDPAGDRVHANRSLTGEKGQDAHLPAPMGKEPTGSRPVQNSYGPDGPSKACLRKPSSIIKDTRKPRRKAVKKPAQESVVSSKHIKKKGIALVELSLLHLLSGDESVTDCLVAGSLDACEGIFSISTDEQLFSEALKEELNPLVIRILSASSLPATPVPFAKLEERCLPVYCQYKFHNMNVHKTGGQKHGSHVYFRDVNVVLAGLLSPGELRECLGGPPLEIEVHDRDRQIEEPTDSLASFTAGRSDDPLNGMCTTHYDSPRGKSRSRNPYGIAKLDLSDLLHGQKCVKVSLPINCSSPLNGAGKESEGGGERSPGLILQLMDGPLEPPMPIGHYHEANSMLKVWVEIACPLTQLSSAAEDHNSGCPFGRIVYLCRSTNTAALTRLRSEILRINAVAFQLDSYAEEAVQTALSRFKMSAVDRESKDLDIVTGFHVVDGNAHLFVLEGLKDKAIKRLWETVPKKLCDSEEERVEVLYNSALSFSNRLYDSLDMSLSPIHLRKQLEVILKQPQVYVRDTVHPACLQALSRLSLLFHVKKLRSAVQSSLFPSAEMILSLSREFGLVFGTEEKKVNQNEAKNMTEAEVSPQHVTRKTLTPLDNHNIKYMEWKQQIANEQLHGHTKDFIQVNVEEVHQASLRVQRTRPGIIMSLPALNPETHSFSAQILNSIKQAQESLGREMEKVCTWRFCCSPEYQQALADAADAEAKQQASKSRLRATWRTWDGFRFPGFKSSMESNEHPHRLDKARVEELRKPWKENILHGNTLRPTLTRDTWPWVTRSLDFERYRKPPRFFGSVPPVTIHLAGESLREEQLQYYDNVQNGYPGNGQFQNLSATSVWHRGTWASCRTC
ncbi:hypothetical protein AGOR_G00159430 [Albula goreensis]|uniref:DUF4550 domain-containing protein n=1 Tax=Albula goreensis TaxID=1534307 RepID=A0A8T3D609_9TELE|nr:hypothetical protein AGOR_G00159430 [Albula goreensis]